MMGERRWIDAEVVSIKDNLVMDTSRREIRVYISGNHIFSLSQSHLWK